MAAHAGILYFDGRPAAHTCDALRLGVQPFAPDGVSVHAEDGVAMAHGACHVWTGDRSCAQPWQSPAGFVATWDGRLDNRDDLLLRLGRRLDDETSDVTIAVTVFERWGIDGLRCLIGDWSLAIWDRGHRTLHLARDYMGVRPLYYCATDHAVMWSSSLGEIAQRAHRTDAISEEFVARFMTLQLTAHVTPYIGIRGVPASTCVSFDADGPRSQQRFWRLEPALLRFRDRSQYEEQLRALWSDAVRTRLRVDGTVWAELSGGLDSSSVVCMADALIRSGRVPARAIQPLSHATLHSPEGDERRFIAQVEAQIGRRTEVLGVEEHQECAVDDWDWVSPFATRGVGLEGLRRVRDRGGRLVLSGRAGDAVMGCEPDNSLAILDDLLDARPADALRNLRRWSRSCRKPLVELLWAVARQLLPAQRVRSSDQGERLVSAANELLSPSLRRYQRSDESELAADVARLRPSKRSAAAMVLGYAFGSRLNIPQTPPPIVYAYPFAHRPLVEFMLAVPGEEWSAPGDMRSLMRRAFAGFVPPRVLSRTSKGYYPPAGTRAARSAAASMTPVDRLQIVQRGWVDPKRIDAALHALVEGGGSTSGEVRRAIRLEQWLASRDRRAPAAIPQRKEVTHHEVLNA